MNIKRFYAVDIARAATILGAFFATSIAVFLAGCASSPMPSSSSPTSMPGAPAASRPGGVIESNRNVLPTVSSWAEYRRRAAQLIMAVNAESVVQGALQEPLLGIPVVQVQLNADGSIRFVDTLRASKVAPETTNPALAAIRKVGNFGPVSNLPPPWQFTETFLYNDGMRFQLRTVVEKL